MAWWPRARCRRADLPLRGALRTRLGGATCSTCRCSSESERRAVLREAADARGVMLSDDVLDYMLLPLQP